MRGLLRPCALAVTLALAACVDSAGDVDAPPAPEAGTAPAAPAIEPGVPEPGAPAAAPQPAPAEQRRLRLVATGDISFGRYHMRKRYRRVSGTAEPFAEVAPLLRSADITLGNLETPMLAAPAELRLTPSLHDRPGDPGWSVSFRAEPGDAALLAAAGFTHLSGANNHILDMGGAGAQATGEHLAAAGLTGLGIGSSRAEAGEPAVITAGGVRVAVLARTVWNKGQPAEGDGWGVAYLGNRDLEHELAAEVTRVKARTGADFLVLFLHWGWEYEDEPRDSQRAAARALVAAGADVIIGNHPHVVQTFERDGDAVIAYSLGNFLFDQTYRPTRRSVLLEVVFDGDQGVVSEARLHPVVADGETNAPRLARGKAYRRWARELRKRAVGFEIAAEP